MHLQTIFQNFIWTFTLKFKLANRHTMLCLSLWKHFPSLPVLLWQLSSEEASSYEGFFLCPVLETTVKCWISPHFLFWRYNRRRVKKNGEKRGKNPLGTVVTRIGAPSGDNCKMVSFPSFPDMEKQQEERVNVQKWGEIPSWTVVTIAFPLDSVLETQEAVTGALSKVRENPFCTQKRHPHWMISLTY